MPWPTKTLKKDVLTMPHIVLRIVKRYAPIVLPMMPYIVKRNVSIMLCIMPRIVKRDELIRLPVILHIVLRILRRFVGRTPPTVSLILRSAVPLKKHAVPASVMRL